MRLRLIALLLMSSTVAGRRGGGSRPGVGYGGSHSSHSYPYSSGYSGTGSGGAHNYPHSNGLSGNTNTYKSQYHQQTSTNYNYRSKTEVHYHHHYYPPQQISYGSTYHPVYHGQPPVYVYELRDSGSRFDVLLTGLSLYNLGRMSANHHSYREYSGTPGEICKFGVSKRTGEYEESRIDCKLMSSYIFEVDVPKENVLTKSVTTTVTNVTQNVNGGGSGNNTSVTTVTVKNETVTDALKVKGPSIEVTPGMTCYMIRISRDTSILKKNVECGLLQTYALSSLRRNRSDRVKPTALIALLNFYIIFSYI